MWSVVFFSGRRKRLSVSLWGGDPFGALEWDALCAPTTTAMGVKEVKEPGAF